MEYHYGWRGVVGLVKPTYRPGSLEDFIRLMPEGVGFIPMHVGIRAGTEAEFQEAIPTIEARVAELARLGVDIIVISGAPPMMVSGHGADVKLARELEKRHGVPVLTATMAQVEAMRALGLRSLAGVTYFGDPLNGKFARFLEDSGFKVLAMKGYPTAFADAGRIPPPEVYAFARRVFMEAGGADGVYILGAGWRATPVVQLLEEDLRTTVVASVPAQVWATRKRLRLLAPLEGYGRLLREMPG